MNADIIVHYPADQGRIVMRTEADWDRDIEPVRVSSDGARHEFVIESDEDLLQCKPCLYQGDAVHHSRGENYFVPMGVGIPFGGHPYFFAAESGEISELVEIESGLGAPRRLRVYRPPGYDENVLTHYPVIYMQDGANLFLPEEAFQGQESLQLHGLRDRTP